VREGLRLVEEREAKLQALRDTLNISIARGGEHSDDAVGAHIGAALDTWENAATTR
jgi:antitoxin ParD1/3/4